MSKRVDERTQDIKRRATSMGYLILSWGLTAILLYRTYWLGQDFAQLADVFIVWLAGNLYVALASTVAGVQPFDAMRHANWLVPLVIAGTMTAAQALRGQLATLMAGIETFAIGFVGAWVVLVLMQALYRRWERQNLG